MKIIHLDGVEMRTIDLKELHITDFKWWHLSIAVVTLGYFIGHFLVWLFPGHI